MPNGLQDTDEASLENALLGRVLSDPATGLPNLPYFRLIRDWEERRARRRGTSVRVVRLAVSGGDERLRRSMGWRLCREFRTSDLIASEGIGRYQLLLTSPDADHLDAVLERIRQFEVALNDLHTSPEPLAVAIEIEGERETKLCGPCEPADTERLTNPGRGIPRYEEQADSSGGAGLQTR